MSAPDIRDVAPWLQTRLGMHLFTVDHPGLPECVGLHRREPCNGKRGKHPCVRWSREETTDPGVILAALSREPRNLGIACEPSRVLVVDEDQPGAYTEYAASVGQVLEPTFAVATSQDRRHYYYRPPDGIALGNSPGALAGHGIDIRGRGGFVVAPGSVHASGVIYTPVNSSAPILPMPGWLTDALRPPPPMECQTSGAVSNLPAYGQAALHGEVARVRDAVTMRNDTLNKAAYNLGRLVGAGTLPAELVVNALFEAASVHFGPTVEDVSPGEARATIRSGLNAGIRKPRQVTTRTR